MEETDAAPPIFRPSKKRKVMRQRRASSSEESPESVALPATDDTSREAAEQSALAEALKNRRNKARKIGLEVGVERREATPPPQPSPVNEHDKRLQEGFGGRFLRPMGEKIEIPETDSAM